MNVLTDKLRVEFSQDMQSILIINPEVTVNSGILVQIRVDTLRNMSLSEAAEFIGERVLLTMPEMRRLFKDYLDSRYI